MHFVSNRRLALPMAATFALLLLPTFAHAQGKPEEIQFDTADGVEIKGSFYPSANGNKAPCVVLLHELGSDRTKGGWDELAKDLQKEGFAVLAFDFRGHGESTNVNPNMFWKFGSNVGTFRPKGNQTTIDWKVYAKSKIYLPMLTNDLAAAKLYLETRNDASNCNASNVFVVGAKESAAIAALWLANESKRMRMIPNVINPLVPQFDPQQRMYGEDIAGAILFSMPDRLCGMSTTTFLKFPGVVQKMPICFVYGSKDPAATTSAAALKALKGNRNVAVGTVALEVKGTNASGSDLLGKEGVEKKVVTYLNNVLEKRAEKGWNKREVEKLPRAMPVMLKQFGYSLP